MTKLTAFSINAVVKLLELLVRVLPYVQDAIDIFKKKKDEPQKPAS